MFRFFEFAKIFSNPAKKSKLSVVAITTYMYQETTGRPRIF